MDDSTSKAEGFASLVVVLGSSLSLVGIVFAFITYSLFSDLRNLSGTTMMNLLAGLFMAQLLYVIGVGGVQDADLCSALSLSLQYVRLAVLCWLTASAHHMHATFMENPTAAPKEALSASFVRYSLFGWGLPLLCLLASASLQQASQRHGPPDQLNHHSRQLRLRRRPHEHMVEQLLHHEALVLGTKVDHLPRRHNSTSILGSSSTFLSEDLAATEGDCWFPEGGTWAFGLGFLAPAVVLLIADAVLLVKCALLLRHNSHALLPLDRRTSEKIRASRRLQVCLFARLSILIGIITALGAAARFTTESDHQHPPHPSPAPNSTVNTPPSSTLVPIVADGVIASKEDNSPGTKATHQHGEEVLAAGSSAIWLAFDVANALQGIVVALFVTCDCGVLRLYTRSLRRGGSKKRKKRKDSLSRGGGGPSRGKKGPPWRPGMPNTASLQLLTLDPAPDTV
ncbi:uncharacterized protein LOC124164212 [Ischnura elegans]|uniref:uncharacterized protein LOC124164212 n=1 Tax=Ischnura elegans TaxID=197161 RepID=UPI001ED890ED|nr:uncharacterized protein LOC124164212 [Ischnura elegans]